MSESINPQKLYYPKEIADEIGISANEIGFLKKKGCPFFGKKTTVAWVREFIAREAGAIPAAAVAGHAPSLSVSR